MGYIDELKEWLSPASISISKEILEIYSYDASGISIKPSIVITAYTTDDILFTVKIASRNNVALTVRGAGSGLTGGSIPKDGGIILNLEKMNKLLHIDKEKLVAIVEPGIINGTLQKRLEKYNCFYPCDPGSSKFSTIGGNLAENASGMKGKLFGSCITSVLGVQYINAIGKTINTGILNKDGESNRILQNIIAGSEGTLGIISKIALKLEKIPETKTHFTSLIYFSSDTNAIDFILELSKQNIIPFSLEYMDKESFNATNLTQEYKEELASTILLIEWNNNSKQIKELINSSDIIKEISSKDNSMYNEFWNIRKNISPSLFKIKPNKINEDIAVPMDKIYEFIDYLHTVKHNNPLISIFVFGHASIGCFHINLMFDKSVDDSLNQTNKIVKSLLKKVIELKGTISTEHGIGLSKKEFLSWELGKEVLELNQYIRYIFDKKCIFNPGKIFDPITLED